MRLRLALVATSFWLLGSFGAASADPGIAEVEALLEKNRHDEAIAYLEALASERDARGLVSYHLAKAHLGKGNVDEAEDWITRAVKKDRANAAYYNARAGVYFRQTQEASILGKMGLAGKLRQDLEKAVELEPDNVEYRMDLLGFYTGAPGIAGGSNHKAMEQAEAIAKLDPVQGYRARADVYLADDKPEQAEAEYLEGLTHHPDSYDLNIGLVLGYGQLKQYEKAHEAIGRWQESVGGDGRADYQLGRLAAISGEYLTEGEAALRRYLELEELPEHASAFHWAYYRLGLVLRHQGHADAATVAFGKARELGAEDKQLLAMLDDLD